MKKFSEIVNAQKLADYTQPVMEASGDDGVDIDSMLDDFINSGNGTNPQLVVADNPKMKRIADEFISLVNKKCGWNAYTHTFFKNIDGLDTILIFSGKDESAVSISPTQSGSSAIIRYYTKYDTTKKEQMADYTVSSNKMGLVKMFTFMFEIINNPDVYLKGVYEKKNNASSTLINEKNDYADAGTLYRNIKSTNVFPAIEKFIKTDGAKRAASLSENAITIEGIKKLAEVIKEEKITNPVILLQILMRKDAESKKYKSIIANKELSGKGAGDEACAAILWCIFNMPEKFGMEMQTDENTEVEVEECNYVTEAQTPSTYRGIDTSMLIYFNMDFKQFKKLADRYFKDLDELHFQIEELVKFCKKTRPEKLKDLHVGAAAVFVSGTGGIGKSYTWENIRNTMGLKKVRDYAERGSGACNARELYSFIYHNNGRVLVFDDTADLFKTAYQRSLWLHVLEAKGDDFVTIEAPNANEGGGFYSMREVTNGDIMNCRKRYFKECPGKINKAKNSSTRHSTNNDADENQTTVERKVPNETEVMSRFIIMTNMTQKELAKMMGGQWEAIKRRTYFVRIAPPVLAIWSKIKNKLIQIRDTNDTGWVVPPECVDEVIQIVEKTFEDAKENNEQVSINWGTFTSGTLEQYFKCGRDWREPLRDSLIVRKDTEDFE